MYQKRISSHSLRFLENTESRLGNLFRQSVCVFIKKNIYIYIYIYIFQSSTSSEYATNSSRQTIKDCGGEKKQDLRYSTGNVRFYTCEFLKRILTTRKQTFTQNKVTHSERGGGGY